MIWVVGAASPIPWYQNPGWWAIGLSVVSLVVSVAVAISSGRARKWRRAFETSSMIEDSLKSIGNRLNEHMTPEAAQNLWAPSVDVHLQQLRESVDSLADRRMRKQLVSMVDSLTRLRGSRSPVSDEDGRPSDLTREQRELLKVAVDAYDQYRTRRKLVIRKGSVS